MSIKDLSYSGKKGFITNANVTESMTVLENLIKTNVDDDLNERTVEIGDPLQFGYTDNTEVYGELRLNEADLVIDNGTGYSFNEPFINNPRFAKLIESDELQPTWIGTYPDFNNSTNPIAFQPVGLYEIKVIIPTEQILTHDQISLDIFMNDLIGTETFPIIVGIKSIGGGAALLANPKASDINRTTGLFSVRIINCGNVSQSLDTGFTLQIFYF